MKKPIFWCVTISNLPHKLLQITQLPKVLEREKEDLFSSFPFEGIGKMNQKL